MTKRDASIDLLKALAVSLVIVGHVIQYFVPNYDNSTLFRLIYSFHMPLFMVLSGYFARPGKSTDMKIKFERIFLPFVIWSLICIYARYLQSPNSGDYKYLINHIVAVFFSPDDGGLWFLWVLFLNFLVFYFLTEKNLLVCSFVILLFLYLVGFLTHGTNILGLALFKWYYPFFVFGYYLRANLSIFDKKLKTRELLFVLIVTLVLFNQWERVSITTLFGFQINGAISRNLVTLFIKLLVAVGFIVIIFSLRTKVYSFSYFRFFAVNSLGFYALQFLILDALLKLQISFFKENLFLNCCAIIFITSSFCIFFIYLLNKWNFTRHYFLGKA